MKQEVGGNAEQVAGRDVVNHIEVRVAAPDLHTATPADAEGWEREIDMHVAFRRRVGIECSRPARKALERLLFNHNFTARDLRDVWCNGALHFDERAATLVAKPSRKEAVFGAAVFLLGLAPLAPLIGLYLGTASAPIVGASFIVSMAIYVLMLFHLTIRQLVLPYRTALRLDRVLGQSTGGAS